jgi:Raf kinase inhibitor-like YbhB/YbcL family protein
MRHRPPIALLLAGLVAAGVVACSSSDGRSLPPPRVPQTTTVPSAPIVQPGSNEVFVLSSPSFPDGGAIPERFTCRGDEVSPALSWSGTPLDASSLALVVRDRDANGFVHWVVTGIDPFVLGVGEGGLPEGATELVNATGTAGWAGPCPPAGSGTHTYEVELLALDDLVELPLDTPAEDAATALEEAAIDRAVLTGTVAAP